MSERYFPNLEPQVFDQCPCELATMVPRFYDIYSPEGRTLQNLAMSIDAMHASLTSIRKHMEFEEMFLLPLSNPLLAERVRSEHRQIREQIERLGAPLQTTWFRHGMWEKENLRPLVIYEESCV
jgi:hypothetical protein